MVPKRYHFHNLLPILPIIRKGRTNMVTSLKRTQVCPSTSKLGPCVHMQLHKLSGNVVVIYLFIQLLPRDLSCRLMLQEPF